jgi:hypothetical protein
MLLIVFVGSLIRPVNDEWNKISFSGWTLHKESIIGQIMQTDIGPNKEYFANEFYSEINGVVDSIYVKDNKKYLRITGKNGQHTAVKYNDKNRIVVEIGSVVKTGDTVYTGNIINRVFYIDFARILLLSVFLMNVGFIYIA